MAEGWSVLLSETSGAPRRPRRKTGRLVAAGVAFVAVAVLLVIVISRDGTSPEDRSADSSTPRLEAPALALQPDGAESSEAPTTAQAVRIPLYGKPDARLSGVTLLEEGKLDAAEKWLREYLSAPSDGRDDQALFALGVVQRARGRLTAAENTFRKLIRTRSDSLYAGDGLHQLALLVEESGRRDEARKVLHEAVRVYARSCGGRLAARTLADELYAQHVEGKKRRSEWERIRDLYSIALPGLAEGTDRTEVIARLNALNKWIVFTPYARPAPKYPTNIVFHTVKARETIGLIAKKYGVTQGAIRRLNDIPPDSNTIRVGDELKVLRGRAEIHIDLQRLRMTVWINGSFFREYPVGAGRDGRTPAGQFTIATRVIDPDWYQGSEVIPPWDPRNILGSRWLGFTRKGAGRGIGIHGSVLKDSVWQGVGERSSNGCIRMRNPDVEELFDFVPIGIEVTISE